MQYLVEIKPYGIIEVDCKWKSYDPDQFEIYEMAWEPESYLQARIRIPLTLQNANVKCIDWHGRVVDRYLWEMIFEYIVGHYHLELSMDY